jgi:transcriptional regulator with XRE-family HTH domain
MVDRTEIRARIKYLIERIEGGNVSAMAKKIGASPVLVRDWVTAKSTPKIDYRRKIADAYDTTLDWIEGREKIETLHTIYKDADHTKNYTRMLLEAQLEARMYQEMYKNLKSMYDQLIDIINKDKK